MKILSCKIYPEPGNDVDTNIILINADNIECVKPLEHHKRKIGVGMVSGNYLILDEDYNEFLLRLEM